jgi:hypothetical protein
MRDPYLKISLAVMIHLHVAIYTVLFIWDVWVYSQINVSCFLPKATIIKTLTGTDNNYSADDLK